MIVTTGRADYGLLFPLIKKCRESAHLNVDVIATGTHLSPLHGKTINLIKKDKVKVTGTVPMTMKSDSESALCKAISKGLLGFSKLLEKRKPDLVVVLGDRYELWSVCMAAVLHKIPIGHLHGGEATFGLIDDPIRHSVTKMSAFHFASIDLYAKRIIQMGEAPERVFVVGAIGLDNIKMIPLMSQNELSTFTGVDFQKNIALMTYHPVTLDDYAKSQQQAKEIFNALLETDLITLITMPNADTSGNKIFQEIGKIIKRYPKKFKLVKNMGQKGYLSAMKYSKLMIGNSSSGIIESASFKMPVVNIGDRQAGRFKPENIIDCICSKDAIQKSIQTALSREFMESITHLSNPYGDGNTATAIGKVFEKIDFDQKSKYLKKGFTDLDVDLPAPQRP